MRHDCVIAVEAHLTDKPRAKLGKGAQLCFWIPNFFLPERSIIETDYMEEVTGIRHINNQEVKGHSVMLPSQGSTVGGVVKEFYFEVFPNRRIFFLHEKPA